ncbi:MAG: FtsX-like permease family protein, partial [Acidobacteriota bacterium]
DGASITAARAEMQAAMPERWREAAPGDNNGVAVLPLRGTDIGPTTERFLALLGTVAGALLLVCCANLAGLLSARTGSRARELAIRSSLGAPRARLLRQMMTESVLLALAGAAAGVVLSLLLTSALQSAFYATDDAGRAYYVDLSLSPQVVGGVLVLAVACGLLFGILPALTSARLGGAASTLRRSAKSLGGGGRAGKLLIGAQTAVAVSFVVVAALLVSSATALLRGANYDPEGVALLRLRPRLVGYEPARAQEFVRAAVRAVAELPEVESVTMVGTGVALWGLSADVALPDSEDAVLQAGYLEVGPDYFETLRTPILRGREIEREDDPQAPMVAVVNATLAATLWPEGDAVGREVIVGQRRYTVIGVAADVELQHRGEAPRPYLYTAFWQNPEEVDTRLQVRVRGDAAALLPRLMGAVSRVDPEVPISEPLTLTQRVNGYLRPQRMGAAAVSYAAGLAVLLSAMGLYAALAAGVSARRHELGVRMAVGASAGEVFRMIVRQGSATNAAGVAVGLGVAAAATRLLQHLLYGSPTGDWLLFGGAALAVAIGGVAASLVPAWRAARTAPLRALRPD